MLRNSENYTQVLYAKDLIMFRDCGVIYNNIRVSQWFG